MDNEFSFTLFDLENPIPKKLLNEFLELMHRSFPKQERHSDKAFIELIKTQPEYKIYALLKGGALAAFFTVWEFESFRFGDHFAVLESERNRGLGSKLLSLILSKSHLPFTLEVELPENQIAERRLNFYLRNSFSKNDFAYLLPPMQKGCKALPMLFLSYPKKLCESEFLAIRETIYKRVYNISNIRSLR